MISKKFQDINIDDEYKLIKKITDEKITKFADLSGDFNPLHLNDEFAKNTIFKKRISHGMLSSIYFSAVIANNIPGAIYLSQTLKFIKPVFINDTILILIKVIDKIPSNNQIILDTKCFNNDSKLLLIDGAAKIMLLE